jgi:DNA-binding LacI/PurR family transcriptional regulator
MLGLRVPDLLSIVGFDNLDVADQLEPSLTTVAQPFAEIGRRAAQMLLRRIAGETGPSALVQLSPQMVVRGSVLPLAEMQLTAQMA